MTWWRRPGLSRRQRLVRGAGLADPPPPPEAFAPSAVDEQSYRSRIEQLADSLAGSVDEATGHTLDNLVNALADQLMDSVRAEYQEYLTRVRMARGRAGARVVLTRQLWMHDMIRLAELGVAVEAGLVGLAEEAGGDAPDDPRGRHSR